MSLPAIPWWLASRLRAAAVAGELNLDGELLDELLSQAGFGLTRSLAATAPTGERHQFRRHPNHVSQCMSLTPTLMEPNGRLHVAWQVLSLSQMAEFWPYWVSLAYYLELAPTESLNSPC